MCWARASRACPANLKLLVEAGLLERFREAQFTRFRLVTSGDDALLVREFVRA